MAVPSKTIVIASDHGAIELKQVLTEDLQERGFSVIDLGTDGPDAVDYPDFADALAIAIREGRAVRGVLMCGSGIGMSIAANRHREIRAALVHDNLAARLARRHNDANVLVMGGRFIGIEVAKDCLAAFLDTEFEGGRHARRVAKLS
jgi:ribose 5-phosphate isomerase B